jgi:hypothetical protein
LGQIQGFANQSPEPVKALLLITQTMPNLEHIYLKAPCQASNPVLGGSLILLITSSSEGFNFFWKSSNLWFRLFEFFWAGESNKGILETFKKQIRHILTKNKLRSRQI